MIDDLVAWLRVQLDARERELDEDERVALAASPGPWRPNAEHDEVMAVDDERVADGFALSGNQLRATVDHIARWDPARVLREVETGRAEVDAKRRILDEWEDPEAVRVLPEGVYDGRDSDEVEAQVAAALTVDHIVRLLALPYAGRDGYREEWRP